MGYVYLVQPVVLVGTNRYKIGMSDLSDLSRLKVYGCGTRYLCILECKDARDVERKLIELFDMEYKLIGGREYYEVKDELKMVNLFVDTVMSHKNTQPDITSLRSQWMHKFGRL